MRALQFFEAHPVFTHAEFVAAHTAPGRSEHTSNKLLQRHVATGRILRIQRGLYATVPRGADAEAASVDPYLVATALSDGGAVAYHAALQFHGKVYSPWHQFHFLTRARSRAVTFRGAEFVPVLAPVSVRADDDLGGGLVERPHAGGTVRVATLERTLVDVMDSPDKGGGWEEIWRSLEMVEYFDLDAVADYARRLGSAIAAGRVGFFVEQHRKALMAEESHLAALEALSPKEPRYFDPKRPPGRLASRWNLIVPDIILSRSWQEVS